MLESSHSDLPIGVQCQHEEAKKLRIYHLSGTSLTLIFAALITGLEESDKCPAQKIISAFPGIGHITLMGHLSSRGKTSAVAHVLERHKAQFLNLSALIMQYSL